MSIRLVLSGREKANSVKEHGNFVLCIHQLNGVPIFWARSAKILHNN